MYLVGSAANGDFRPGKSDLDFVAVLSREATDEDLETLAIVHRRYRGEPALPMLDGIWVTEADLLAGPDKVDDGPASHDGAFLSRSRGNRNPVTWFELRRSTSLIGSLETAALWYDQTRLIAWVEENAATYWRAWLARASSWGPPGLAMLDRATPTWGVLGISRLAYTRATGEIASKSCAGVWAREALDARWQRVIDEALAFRCGARSLYANPINRRRDALAFIAMIIDQFASR